MRWLRGEDEALVCTERLNREGRRVRECAYDCPMSWKGVEI